MTKDDFENFWISSAFVYHDSRQREENQILPLGHFEWFRYKSPTSLRLSSKGYFCELKLHGPWGKLLDGHRPRSSGELCFERKSLVFVDRCLCKSCCQKLIVSNGEYEMPQNRTNIPDPSEELMSLFRTFIPTFGTMITTALLFTLDHVFWEILELLVK